MQKPSDVASEPETLREKLIGLGERSIRKGYYPELQQRLAELERFKALLDQSRDAVLFVQIPSGRVIDANLSACQQLGYSRDEILALSLGDLVLPETADAIKQQIVGGSTPGAERLVITQLERCDGGRLPVEITARQVAFGAEVYAVVVARDVTQRIQDEEALREADRRKNEFLAMLAHELRNPLSPIVTSLELIRLQPAAQTPDIRKRVETIGRQVKQLTRIVDDLLDTSRITRGLIVLKKERLPLSAAVDQAVEHIRHLLEAKHQGLNISLPPEPFFLEADRVRLVQILSNLLHNAVKYTPEGGRISLSARREHSQAVIEVQDNGQGIPPDVLPHIFELFYQADTSLARTKGGLGLGLMLVRQLTQLHGGTVEARSEGVNRGSTFTLRLPLQTEGDVVPDPDLAEERPKPTGLRVLIVEDNLDAAESLRELIEMWGYSAWVAHDGPSGIEQAVKIQPDVVLLDIGLPGMDGYETACRLRQEATLSRTVLVAVTGYNPDKPRSDEAGFRIYFTKPVDPAALEDLLRKMMQER